MVDINKYQIDSIDLCKLLPANTKVVLGSTSPRRKDLMSNIFSSFEVIGPTCKEVSLETSPDAIVKDLSLQKANSVFDNYDNYKNNNLLILSSDTLVVYNNKILGKPKSKDEAYDMLMQLKNNWHVVYTGVTLKFVLCEYITNNNIKPDSTNTNNYKNSTLTFYDKSRVHMANLSDNQIKDYIKSKKPMDKAGAYGIQDDGGIYVDKIEGEYNTIMGFPSKAIIKHIKKFDWK